MEFKHIPVLLNETIEGLNITPHGFYLDCTLGGGGHSFEIVKRLSPDGMLLAIDKDKDAIKAGQERLKEFSNVKYFNSDFKNAKEFLEQENIEALDGVLLDLGVSSYQLDNAERGFSYMQDAKLDMRMDLTQDFSAYDVVNTYSFDELVKIFFEYGEEKFAKSIAKNIIKAREEKPIETTRELTAIVERSMPTKEVYSRGGAAKKVFQAIRIEVNGELKGLKEIIEYLISKLKKGGRIAVITFHSLEDRIVKNVYQDKLTDCICPSYLPVCMCNHRAEIKLVNKKPIIASENEKNFNSRSACAKLRVAEKL